MGGAKGSKILITTHSKLVAAVSGTNSLYPLKGLSNEESWSLFKQMAFKEGIEPENPCLVEIGKEIVEKCVGVPLAIRVLGSLLYSRDTVKEWLIFKDKNMTKIAQEENAILPILRLSYDHLPWYLKQCFAFCCLYPKDHVINKQQLIQLWMANGFIQLSDKNQDMEDVGDSYFMNLLRRSFFQDDLTDEFGSTISCKMHDLMHDLAQSTAASESSMVNLDANDVSTRTRHVSFDVSFDSSLCTEFSLKIPNPLLGAVKVRTFFLPAAIQSPLLKLEESVFETIVSTFKRLRVLDMHALGVMTVPSCISELRHLRYLDLSNNHRIVTLPNSITNLQNLQTLKICDCPFFNQLPRDIRKLVSLRHLEIDGGSHLNDMPRGMGQLTCLRTLNQFIVGPFNRLSELKNLNTFKG
ncbi:putative disease resistance protein RGA3 isoform X1 [Cornus florida]|uniref:putative disease resistance protein RGA3 isoform X1 n=1 Tax=Cornus florida TaxID=4283 RepID=UPI0028A146FB|nr:putative disease resistance protein RGA3 isoform X1 [Cornus florida]XP_059641686.1 putative disease resistance protein RGA3 isoform X1 [Cornus florida]XP_059641687.1 putative disease resistance protein RGA3 isoform X1 [Cornus florida]